jgi:uncharacterized protein (TIGR03085 family)
MPSERTYLAHADRLALCDLLDQLGPDTPTLCERWNNRDLTAHLVARDRRPDSIPGLVVPALAGWSERVRLGEHRRPYDQLVAALRSGPPAWSPLRVPAADRAGNTHEFFVHLEDVRRAQPAWEPRALDPQAEADLWRVLGWFAARAFRGAPVGIVLRRPDGETHRAKKGTPEVTLTGPPGELLLYAFGRRDHARVDLNGAPEATAQVAATPLSW